VVPAVSPVQLLGVQILSADFNSATATATLRWSVYFGPRFSRYRIERQTAGGGFQTLATANVSTDTSFLDTGLRGNTEYAYRIVTVTAAADEIRSGEVGGVLHSFERSWPLVGPLSKGVRLYADSDGVSAVELFGVSTSTQRRPGAWLIPYGSGELREEWLFTGFGDIQSLATASTHDGLRLTSLANLA
jgi:hypothetical protein